MPFSVPGIQYYLLGVAVNRLDFDFPKRSIGMPHLLATALFWLSVACCLVAQVLIVRSVLAARGLPAVRPELPRARGSVEIMWAVVPGIALAVVLFFTWRAIVGETRAAAPADTAAVAER